MPLRAHARPEAFPNENMEWRPSLANPGMPEPAPGGDIPSEMPPRPYPGERPLGSDEPSAPFEEPPFEEPPFEELPFEELPTEESPNEAPAEPGIGLDDRPGAPADPGLRV
ncbi:MAG: hypothetical protein JWQ05_1856 [Methylobacterium sp.]|nr:hypothetical protein [Methylobacterium sp.]